MLCCMRCAVALRIRAARTGSGCTLDSMVTATYQDSAPTRTRRGGDSYRRGFDSLGFFVPDGTTNEAAWKAYIYIYPSTESIASIKRGRSEPSVARPPARPQEHLLRPTQPDSDRLDLLLPARRVRRHLRLPRALTVTSPDGDPSPGYDTTPLSSGNSTAPRSDPADTTPSLTLVRRETQRSAPAKPQHSSRTCSEPDSPSSVEPVT